MAGPPDEARDKYGMWTDGAGGLLDPTKAPGIAGVVARADLAIHPREPAGIEIVHMDAGPLKTFRNPSGAQTIAFLKSQNSEEGRAIITSNNAYVFNAADAIYEGVAYRMGLELDAYDHALLWNCGTGWALKVDNQSTLSTPGAQRLLKDGTIRVATGLFGHKA